MQGGNNFTFPPLDPLSSLNPAQLKAVKHAPEIPIQILAGPGSGKTKVLTSRIAYLTTIHSIPPSSICAVTFTNKAASEMRQRLTRLIGEQKTSEVRMGTFHALCAMFLREHAKLVGLKGNFAICDAEESKKLISALLRQYRSKDIALKEGTVLSLISRAKAKGRNAAEFLAEIHKKSQKTKTRGSTSTDIDCLVAEIYEKYEQSLLRSNSLDFDDLLLFGVKLFTQHEKTVTWCKHVLVDEFQDTNAVQYELMRALAVAGCVTVVGDPDQSIYGWRSAEVGNLAKMCQDFNGTAQIFLEQNYRSTAAILNVSLAIIAQDKSRIQKSLHTTHPMGITPVLRPFPTEQLEATFIAVEIKRLVAIMGGVFRWGDFVVLLRFNALSRVIESALQKEGIPSRVLGGHKFFERVEIKDLLAYLQLVDNPDFTPALTRAVNVPGRGIGEKTLLELSSRAEKMKVSQLDVIEGIHDNRLPDMKLASKRKLVSFVKNVRVLRDLSARGTSPADLIRRLIELIEYKDHLKKTQPDWESRWENVQELITFASEVDVTAYEGDQTVGGNIVSGDTPLRLFLQASMLSSEGDNHNDADSKEKVTISTCHAAKGLEWPVVMVPAIEEGTFPFYRTDDIEEERRLLYVACTRAQGLLYLSHAAKRRVGGETVNKKLSPFVSVVAKENPDLFAPRKPTFLPQDKSVISNILSRPLPDESEVARRIAEFDRTTRHHAPDEELEDAQTSWHPMLTNPQPVTKVAFFASSNLLRTSYDTASQPSPKTPSSLVPSQMAVATTQPASRAVHPSSVRQPLTSQPPFNNNPPIAVKAPQAHMEPLDAPQIHNPYAEATSQGAKRRLGMGRGTVGYSNKKFKPPT